MKEGLKEKRISELDQCELGEVLDIIIETRSWRLLGCDWKEYWEFFREPSTGDIIIRYK